MLFIIVKQSDIELKRKQQKAQKFDNCGQSSQIG